MSTASETEPFGASPSMQPSGVLSQTDNIRSTAPPSGISRIVSNTLSFSRSDFELYIKSLFVVACRCLDLSLTFCEGVGVFAILTLLAFGITLGVCRGSAFNHFRRIILLGGISHLIAMQKLRAGISLCTGWPQLKTDYSSPWWREETPPLTPRPRSIGRPAAMSLSPRLQKQYEQKQSPLFSKLPPEIRNRIYEMAIGDKLVHMEVIVPWRHHSKFGSRPRMQHYRCRRGSDPNTWNHSCWHPNFLSRPSHMDPVEGLLKPLLVCRRMYNEAIPFLYANNTFHINELDFFLYADELLLPERLVQIRSLKVELDLSNKRQRCQVPPRELESVIDGEYTALWEVLRLMAGLREFKLFIQIDPMSEVEWHSIKERILGEAKQLTLASFNIFISGGPFANEDFNDSWLEDCQKQIRSCRIQTSWPQDQWLEITNEKGELI